MSSIPPEPGEQNDGPRGEYAEVPIARPIAASPLITDPLRDPMLLEEISRKWAGLDMLVFIGLLLAYLVFAGLIVSPYLSGDVEGDYRLLELAMMVVMGTLAVALAVLLTCWHGLRLASLGLIVRHWRWHLFLGLAAAAASWATFQIVAVVIGLVWQAGYDQLLENTDQIQTQLPRLEVPAITALTVFVAVWEEVVFRGFILPRMRRLTDSWPVAVVFSSAIFAVLHVGMQVRVVVIPVFCLGVLLSVVTIWRRSLIPAIVAHFLFDFVNFLWMLTQFPEWE